jgi:hypothetical protein
MSVNEAQGVEVVKRIVYGFYLAGYLEDEVYGVWKLENVGGGFVYDLSEHDEGPEGVVGVAIQNVTDVEVYDGLSLVLLRDTVESIDEVVTGGLLYGHANVNSITVGRVLSYLVLNVERFSVTGVLGVDHLELSVVAYTLAKGADIF